MAVRDNHIREQATTTVDRNIVVTAGAGTGKTTLLVDRLIHLLYRQPHPLRIGEIVALTFTNKSAREIAFRLRSRLLAFRELTQSSSPLLHREPETLEEQQWQDLVMRYALTNDQMRSLSIQALDELERSHIGTIHSFAAHLLRLYPIQSGVDPSFREDDGSQFIAHFEREWAAWLDHELGIHGKHHEVWRTLLQRLGIADIKELVLALTDESIPLPGCGKKISERSLSEPVKKWVRQLVTTGQHLREVYSTSHVLEILLEESLNVLSAVSAFDSGGVHENVLTPLQCQQAQERLNRGIPPQRSAWAKDDYEQARQIIQVAQSIPDLATDSFSVFLRQVIPFVQQCRQEFVESGYVSFSGLLARARDLVCHHLHIRQELKRQIQAVLVDEFQDTDPIQYELLLYLAEEEGQEARTWKDLLLQPGKFFIVGDPKQSIYAFRRADMEAFDVVVNDLVLAGGARGDALCLQTNFRSHMGLLNALNACFSHVFPSEPQKGLQPKYEALQAVEDHRSALEGEGITIRLVTVHADDADADAATRAEAEELARWMKEEVFRGRQIMVKENAVDILPCHVALVFRTLIHAPVYLEALRRYGIPYITEGEKHFYLRQEIIDFVNVLNVALSPDNHLALVGVLRSSLGGMADVDIERLVRHKKLDIREASKEHAHDYPLVYSQLHALHHLLPRIPVEDIVDVMMSHVPLVELAAASMDGEQTMANVLKLREIVRELAQQPDMSLSRLATMLSARIADPPPEAEMSLSEEGQEQEKEGSVQILSIHKAKGLEFPVVIVAGLHRGIDRRGSRVFVQHDWTSGLVGLRVGSMQTWNGLYLNMKLKDRERAEQIRLLYVAMTRAKRWLIVSAGIVARKHHSQKTLLNLIAEGMQLDLDALLDSGEPLSLHRLGESDIRVEVIRGSERMPSQGIRGQNWREQVSCFQECAANWNLWVQKSERAHRVPLFGSPTSGQHRYQKGRQFLGDKPGILSADEEKMREGVHRRPSPHVSRLIGVLAHQVLENWDYSTLIEKLHTRVRHIWHNGVCHEREDDAQLIKLELEHMFQVFGESSIYATLQKSEILGQEVPFAIPWGTKETSSVSQVWEQPLVMEGMIDLLYRLNGEVWIADYKTDRVQGQFLDEYAARYQEQLRIYSCAVAESLGMSSIRNQVIFLRSGQAVEV